MAHHFCVQVYRAELRTSRSLEDVVAVLEREKPAHTAYHLCVIEPRMRVGFQARVGVDTVVGGAPPALTLDEGQGLGVGTVLGEGAAGDRGRVGHSRIGRHTRLS
jgi:hypothetical protein